MRIPPLSRPYGRREFRGRCVELRPPRISDAAAWALTRSIDEQRLRPAFGADIAPDGWGAANSELVFLERCLRLRWAAQRGRALPAIVVTPTPAGPLVFGELGIDAVDPRTETGEVSAWMSAQAPGGAAVWGVGTVVLHAFTRQRPLRRVVAPAAKANVAVYAALRTLGFRRELTMTRDRVFAGELADHDIWVLHNTSEARAGLRRVADPGGRAAP